MIRLIVGQHLPIFSVMMTFAAPLVGLSNIQGNLGFMLSGPARKGKSTCLDLAASVCGQPLDHPAGRYSKRFTSTTFRLAEEMVNYGDMPFLIDELGAVGANAARSGGFKDMVHLFNGVDVRGRFGDPHGPTHQVRCTFLITSNFTLPDMTAGEPEDSAEAVADRLHEVPVPRGNEGAFNAGHDGFSNYQELADELRRRMGLYHGTAMPAFLEKLVEHLHADSSKLFKGLDRRVIEFAEHVQTRVPQEVSSRVLRAFGLVYAAGQLAKHYRVLPRQVDCLEAALHCLALNVGQKVEADPLQRLLSWFTSIEPRDLRGLHRLPDLTDEHLHKRGAFIGLCAGQPQVWVSPERFRATFADHTTMLKALDRRGTFKKTAGRKTIQCAIRANKKSDRMFVFRGSEIAEWLESNGFGERPTRRRRG